MILDYKKVQREVDSVLKDNFIVDTPIKVDELAANYGLNIVITDFGEFKKEVAGFLDFEKKVIYVNNQDSAVRQAFTVAHELGHWLLHKQEVEQNPDSYGVLYRRPLGQTNNNPLEKEANYFAAHLLVPNDFLEKYKELDDKNLIAKIFGVSTEVIGYRLNDVR